MVDRSLHILVIDDSLTIRAVVRQALFECGHQVELADNARAGLACLRARIPDVILLDVEMPDMNGFEFCTLIRKQNGWKKIPVIFLSGRGDEEAVVSGFICGGNDYIPKPFNETELVVRVETHGNKARMERELEQKTRALEELTNSQESIIAERTAALEASRQALTETLARLATEQRIQDELVDSRRLASLGKLVADVAHQINTPLGNNIMLASFLAQCLDTVVQDPLAINLPPSMAELLGQLVSGIPLIQGNLARIDSLVGRFRSVAAEEQGGEHVGFSMGPIFELLAIRYQSGLRSQGIDLEFRDEIPAGSTLTGYPGTLNVILENLLGNARDHAFGARAAGRVLVRAYLDAGQVVLECRDDGRGMDEQLLARIWEPFFTTGTSQAFLGLGLFVVRNLTLGRLQGRVLCESAPGAGSLFRITFPMLLD